MVLKIAVFKLPRCWRFLPGPATVFLIGLSLGSAEPRTRQYPETNVTRGKTPGGYSYMSGGISFDEQRAMERAAKSYNLKVVFARAAGTLVAPAFVMIGANDGRGVDKIEPRAPWFYIQLPPGGYTILARFDRQVVLVRDVFLREGARATFRLRGD